MSPEAYWISKTVVVDWPLVDLDGDPITDATVEGIVSLPDGTTDDMTVTQVGDVARATYDPQTAGWHAYRLEATGTGDSAEEGRFYVHPSLVGGAPIDYTTDAGKLRLLIADTDPTRLILDDEQVDAFLAIETGVKRAAAAALEAIARSEALVSKVIRTQDLQTDGAKLAAELRASAKALRDQADVDDENADEDGGLEIVDFDPSRWGLNAYELAETEL